MVFKGYNLIEIGSHSYLFCMTTTTNDYFYIDYMPQRKSKKYRCRIQLNGVRWIEYFETKEEAEAYKLELFDKRTKSYRKGNHQYFSLFYIFNEWLKDKKLEWSDASAYGHKLNFEKVFYSLKDKWFHLITFEDCVGLLHQEEGSINTGKFYYSFQCLQEMNRFSLNKYGYSLGWDVSLIRKKVKLTKGSRKKPREHHTLQEIKAISSFLRDYDYEGLKDKRRGIRNTEELYHIYRLGLFLGCRVGELCSLKKSNYDKQGRTLIINSTISVSPSGNSHFKDSNLTKTKTSRSVQLSDMAIESIDFLISVSTSKYIVPNFTGGKSEFLIPKSLREKFKYVFKHIDAIWIGTHGMFRKTFATQIAQSSDKSHRDMIASIQKHLGHKSPQMTLHYIQAIDTDLSDELSKLDDLI